MKKKSSKLSKMSLEAEIEKRRFNFIRQALRRVSFRWPPRGEALRNARVGKQINKKSGRLAEHYSCAACAGVFAGKCVRLDHILPVIDPAVGFQSWDSFLSRLLPEVDGWQVLCEGCHQTKTNEERTQAKERRGASAPKGKMQ